MVVDYAYLKRAAKENKMPVTDLIALAPSNDPFYVGTPNDILVGQWFAMLWERFGYADGVHIRRMHYQIVSQDPPILMTNGKPYENTEGCWDYLNAAAKQARYLEYVSASAFVDRRNRAPEVFMVADHGRPTIDVTDLWSEDFASLPNFPRLPNYGISNYVGDQRYLIEVWCEKSTMNDILIPFCQKYGCNLVTGLGELSITAVVEAMKRIDDQDKPTRILYISDFDPAGKSMPVAVARKFEYFHRRDNYSVDIRLDPIVLTQEQVRQYNLPRTPIKESERRGAAFEARFGEGAVELDALEALYPGELERILLRAAMDYYDQGLVERVNDARRELSNDLIRVRGEVYERHQARVAELRAEYATAKLEAERALADIKSQMRREFQEIARDLSNHALDPDDYPIPEADESDESDTQLYVSGREYMDQLLEYKIHQGKA